MKAQKRQERQKIETGRDERKYFLSLVKKYGWAIACKREKIPDEIIEEFIEELPIIWLLSHGHLSIDIIIKFKGIINYKKKRIALPITFTEVCHGAL